MTGLGIERWHQRIFWPVLFLLLAMTSSNVRAEVVLLDESNFEELTQASTGQTTGKWFVSFTASWCGHCKQLIPVWEELAMTLETDPEFANEGINVAKVDAIQNRELANRFGVKGYPTLLYFADRQLYKYGSGQRDYDSLLFFVSAGYKSETGQKVPPPPTWIEKQRKALNKMFYKNKHLAMLNDDVEHILKLRKNAAAVLLVVGLLIGILLGYILGIWSSGRKQKKVNAASTAPDKPKEE